MNEIASVVFQKIAILFLLANLKGSCSFELEYSLRMSIFLDVAPCRSGVNRRFGGTSIHTRTTRRHIPEDGILHSHRCENLKSYMEYSYSPGTTL
jgi:hypothetical protein